MVDLLDAVEAQVLRVEAAKNGRRIGLGVGVDEAGADADGGDGAQVCS